MTRSPATAKPVTLQTIADAIGYSRHTVGFVLNGTKEFPEATREKVLRAAHELGYRPNASARAIRSGRFKAIGFLDDMDSSRSHLNPFLLRGIVEHLTTHDHHLILSRFNDAQLDVQSRLPKALTQLLVDGFLINYHTEVPVALKRWLMSSGRSPAVWINRRGAHDCVRPDDHAAGRELVRHCRQRGHQRIAYIDTIFRRLGVQGRHFSKDLRLSGYREGMHEAGLDAIEMLDFSGSHSDMLHHLWSPALNATAVICYSGDDLRALSLIAPLLGSGDQKRLLVTGIGDREQVQGLPAVSMAIDWEGLGQQGAAMLLERLKGAGPLPERLVSCRLIGG